MKHTVEFEAVDWLDQALREAEREVEKEEAEVKWKRRMLRMSEGHLRHAVEKLDAIRLIITRSELTGSANPADK